VLHPVSQPISGPLPIPEGGARPWPILEGGGASASAMPQGRGPLPMPEGGVRTWPISEGEYLPIPEGGPRTRPIPEGVALHHLINRFDVGVITAPASVSLK